MKRYKIIVSGIVQGVGFRPFIYQLASKFHLNGFVYNTSGTVDIEVEGAEENIFNFANHVRSDAPTASVIRTFNMYEIELKHDNTFSIVQSLRKENEYQLLSPDLATCQDCINDIFDKNNRRYRYAFTNCTNCGPRFTIINDIPYDRPLTTMGKFEMCPICHNEYINPLDRRFHAQPNACPVCGPKLELIDNNGNKIYGDVINNATNLINDGKILAIKGLGGFLLTCDACNESAVNNLRLKKHRPVKPFAVMMTNIESIKNYCYVNETEENLLKSSKAPIVLLKLKSNIKLADSVAPDLNELGVMLPYTPLHHILLAETDKPLIMTSGNITEEPIVNDNEEAKVELSKIADYLLLHNRDITRRYDDSVVAVFAGKERIIRRARGYAPFPITLPFKTKQTLACGSDLKNTFCLTRDNNAFVSQHIGDMENSKAYDSFIGTISDYKKIFRIDPEYIACDMHPNYFSSNYARELAEKNNIQITEIQHHHAHIVSAMAENDLTGNCLGIALDGTGYGTDGNIWGFEFLDTSYKDFKRLAHIEYLPLPGGDSSVKNPIKIIYAYLIKLFGTIPYNILNDNDLSEIEKQIINIQLKNGTAPLTSSCGRLFDAVSALLNLCKHTSYEAEAAIKLENAAIQSKNIKLNSYNYEIVKNNDLYIISMKKIFDEIIEDIKNSTPTCDIAYRFHLTIKDIVLYNSKLLLKENHLEKVCISGGVLQNKLLLTLIIDAFKEEGIQCFTNIDLPSNDGCISYGQAVICNSKIC